MSLSAREQQALYFIEDGLAGSDPGLASLLATFSRLTSGEEMPAREKILPARWRDPRAALRLRRHLGLQHAMLLLWLLIAFAMIAVAVVIGGGGGTCQEPWPTVCTASVTAHSSPPVAGRTAADPALGAAG